MDKNKLMKILVELQVDFKDCVFLEDGKVNIPFNYNRDSGRHEEMLDGFRSQGYKIELLSFPLGDGGFKYSWELHV